LGQDRNASLIVVCPAQVWVKELNQYVDNIVIAVVGNKSDLEGQRVRLEDGKQRRHAKVMCGSFPVCCAVQEVDAGKAERYAETIGAIFFETSAKTNSNVYDLFTALSASYHCALCGWRGPCAHARLAACR
jgi:GTPase SAR1 family protein